MNTFVENLQRSGYLPFYLFFGDGNIRLSDWAVAAKGLAEPLRSLVRLFLLQQPVKRSSVLPVIGEAALAELKEAGVLRARGQELATGSFCLFSFRGYLYFAQLGEDPKAYFGEDSVALGVYQTPAVAGRVLDLCSGPGIQSLIASRAARRVTGVELTPEAWKVARLNQRLNGVGDHLEFVNCSLQEFARRNQEQFDRILFNPPLVPVPEHLSYPLVGHGGRDGLTVTESILDLYLEALAPGGRFEFIGMTMGSSAGAAAGDPLLALAKKHRMHGTIHILSKHRFGDYSAVVNACATTLARSNGLEPTRARDLLLQHFAKSDYEFCYLFFCSWGRAAGRRLPSCSVIDLSFYYFGDWFA
jgi:SAM-dependent methyltransferase